jgi:hypothetical protein
LPVGEEERPDDARWQNFGKAGWGVASVIILSGRLLQCRRRKQKDGFGCYRGWMSGKERERECVSVNMSVKERGPSLARLYRNTSWSSSHQ